MRPHRLQLGRAASAAAIVFASFALACPPASAQIEKPDLDDCGLYITGAARDEQSRKIVFSGSIGNPGPGTVRNVGVEVALMSSKGKTLFAAWSGTSPGTIGPGEQASFDVDVPVNRWNRALAAIDYAGPRVTIKSGRCLTADAGEVDDAGRSRADYLDAAMEALETRAVLRYEKRIEKTKRARLQMHGASNRRRRAGAQAISGQRSTIAEIDHFLKVELPLQMRAANAPEEWVSAIPAPPSP